MDIYVEYSKKIGAIRAPDLKKRGGGAIWKVGGSMTQGPREFRAL